LRRGGADDEARMTATADPYVEQLLDQAPARAATGLAGRELWAELGLGALLLAVVAALAAVVPYDRPVSALTVVVLVAAYAVSQHVRFDVGAGYTVPSQLVLVPMLMLAPPASVPLLVAAGLVLGRLPRYLRGDVHPTKLAFVLPDAWHAAGPALVFAVLAPEPVAGAWWVLVLALAAQVVVDAGMSVLRDWLALGVPPQLQLRLLGFVFLVDGALASVGFLVGLAAAGAPAAAVLVLPLMGLLALFARERRDRIDHALALSRAYRGTALLMSDMLVADDAYTGGEHSHGVVTLALAVGDAMGIEGADRRNLELGALLHDVGKIRVADEIINKPGRLTDAEFELIKRHPVDGQQMLERIGGVLAEVGEIVRHHHERWDGGGYPDAIAGEAIPLASRIICATDAWSAMTTTRSYRVAMEPSAAREELERCAGTQFDPDVVSALLMVVELTDGEHVPARALVPLG
jgi:putative nucleotidyltransferase with HDIG domain